MNSASTRWFISKQLAGNLRSVVLWKKRQKKGGFSVRIQKLLQGLVSMGLAATLFLCSPVSIAAEICEETLPQPTVSETVAPTLPEETQPEETTVPQTLPEETIPEETLPVETVPEETQSEETTEPATEPPETTEPATEPPETEPSVTLATVAYAKTVPSGTEGIHLRGTLVYLEGNQAVLQDNTGGIRLLFDAPPLASLGDVLQVTGHRTGGLHVTDYENQGPGTLPVREMTLLEAPELIRVVIRGATLGYGSIQQGGFSLPLVASLSEDTAAGGKVDVYGVILDGQFHADKIVARKTKTAAKKEEEWNLYFGQLHAHTAFSDGSGTVQEAFDYASKVSGLDFFAVTDHSDSFDNANMGTLGTDGSPISTEWATGKAAAAAVTDEKFVGLFGFEMSWPEDMALGHINTFNTPGWQTWDQIDTLEGYFASLSTVPGAISQFNHPSHQYGNFHEFSRYDSRYDNVIQLIEIGKVGSRDPYDHYIQALDTGWHLAPTNNQNNHNGSWGDASEVRTVVLAKELTEAALYDAMANHRVYATEDKDLAIRYCLNGAVMGSFLPPAETLTVTASLADPTDEAIGRVEVIGNQGKVLETKIVKDPAAALTFEVPTGYDYYFLRITQSDGQTAVTAPVWVDRFEDVGIAGFTAETDHPEQDQQITLKLELFNHEKTELVLETLEFFCNGTLFHPVSQPGTVQSMQTLVYQLPFSWDQPGELRLEARISGTVAGIPMSHTQELILYVQPKSISQSTVAQVRRGEPGEAYRITGCLTSGNDNPYTTFSDVLYLQDTTGGIAVTGIRDKDLEVGTTIDVTGLLARDSAGNLLLRQTDYRILGKADKLIYPETVSNKIAMDYAAHGGELLQIQGKVLSLDGSGKSVSRFTLKDAAGTLATVQIDPEIRSGAYGANQLSSVVKKGRTVQVKGLLHKDESGKSVLRLRDCDEVLYIPPLPDKSNPNTADIWGMAFLPAFIRKTRMRLHPGAFYSPP